MPVMTPTHAPARLHDGTGVALRALEPSDRDGLAAALDALSPESRRMRFLGPVPHVGPALLRHLTEVDQHDHVVIVAEHAGQIVGDVRYVRLRTEPRTAEMAFFVGDAFQRRGLGRLLVLTAAALARADGIDTLTFTVAADNLASRALLAQLGVRFAWSDGVLEGRLATSEAARPVGARVEDLRRGLNNLRRGLNDLRAAPTEAA